MKRTLKKSLLLMLSCCLLTTGLMTGPVWADSSTTTVKTASKDQSANTQIFIASDDRGTDYPYYGAKNEPTNGVYFGRTAHGGTLPGGGWGNLNTQEVMNSSMISFYYELTSYTPDSTGHVAYPLSYWEYIFGGGRAAGSPLLQGDHALLIYLNYHNEKKDFDRIINGTYDTQLKEDFEYLKGLGIPVFLRIAGEVNVWNGINSPTDAKNAAPKYISSFRHIADLAHKYAPNVAVVFSPNYSSAYQVDMDTFYPGDAYVDWIGTSLYYNRYAANGDTKNDAFYGVGAYGDALLNVQQTINLSNLHRRPVILTEGGSAWDSKGRDTQAFAADRVQKAYAYLTMLYPQIKAIVHSDYKGVAGDNYTLYGNTVMTDAYNKGVNSNPTLLHGANAIAQYYSAPASYRGGWQGKVKLAAYTYSSPLAAKPTATWYLDGAAKATVADYPYTYELDCDSLSQAKHTVQVRFSNGASKSFVIDLAHTHVWGGAQLAEAVTDDHDGKVIYRCKICSTKKTVILPVGGSPFADVQNEKDYFYEPVQWALEHEITSGVSSFEFAPDDPCTRAQVVTFLWRAAQKPEPAAEDCAFTDVSAGAYYRKPVLWAGENAITQGVSATRFGSDEFCTRAQVVTFLWRTAGNPEPETEVNPFTDISESDYYYKAVLWAVENKITNGVSATAFGPDSTCTRGQIVTFLARYFADKDGGNGEPEQEPIPMPGPETDPDTAE